jgi:hypothetical protein
VNRRSCGNVERLAMRESMVFGEQLYVVLVSKLTLAMGVESTLVRLSPAQLQRLSPLYELA